jgi:hypothetical protein
MRDGPEKQRPEGRRRVWITQSATTISTKLAGALATAMGG